MGKWSVYKGSSHWVAHAKWHVQSFDSWDAAYAYAYRHAVAAIHEVP